MWAVRNLEPDGRRYRRRSDCGAAWWSDICATRAMDGRWWVEGGEILSAEQYRCSGHSCTFTVQSGDARTRRSNVYGDFAR